MNKKVKKKVEEKPAIKEKPSIDEAALKKEIKAMEMKKRADTQPKEATPKKVSFDAWFHLRKAKIPVHHQKEIIWSYFKSRGLSKQESIQKYDNELKRYGIKI